MIISRGCGFIRPPSCLLRRARVKDPSKYLFIFHVLSVVQYSVCCAEIWYLTFSKVKQKRGINLELRRRIFCQNWAVSSVWSEELRVFTETFSSLLTADWPFSVYRGRQQLWIVVAGRGGAVQQRKTIVPANFGCDQTGWCGVFTLLPPSPLNTLIVLIFRSHRVPVSRGVWLLSASHWV